MDHFYDLCPAWKISWWHNNQLERSIRLVPQANVVSKIAFKNARIIHPWIKGELMLPLSQRRYSTYNITYNMSSFQVGDFFTTRSF